MRTGIDRWLPSSDRDRQSSVVLLVGLALLSLACRWVAIWTEAVNWDEFSLLARAEATLRSGNVVAGGRPGLVTLLLVPFVRDCTDSVRSVVEARVLWQFFTLAYLAGVYLLVRKWFEFAQRTASGQREASLAVVLLAFLPAFVTWSVQVRTDQPAIAAAAWGGVALLGTGYTSAVIAGSLFALSLLCSQKGVYVAALCAVLYSMALLARRAGNPRAFDAEVRRQAARGVVVVLMAGAVLFAYAHAVPSAAKLATSANLGAAAENMQWVRDRLGYRAYTVHGSRLLLHWFLLAVLLATTFRAVRREASTDRWVVATAWLALAVGALVVWFHGASFPYFLMTAGLFPAVALSLASDSLHGELAVRTRAAVLVLAGVSILFTWPETRQMLFGLQESQRRTMALLQATGLNRQRGYQVEGALFCSKDPDPLPAMFTQQIRHRFGANPHARAAFLAEFRARPVAYLVESYRLRQFPREMQEFWDSHYVPYAAAIHVAGFAIKPATTSIDVLLPGHYRWRPGTLEHDAGVVIDGILVDAGIGIDLAPGPHTIDAGSTGTLLPGFLPERSARPLPFYDPRQVQQLRGYQ